MWLAKAAPQVRLGSLVSVWTPHISANDPKTPSQHEGLYVSIFPEKDNSCHIEVHLEEDNSMLCRNPLTIGEASSRKLMTLENLADGGHELHNCRVLVCVKSIGQRKRRKGIKIRAALLWIWLINQVNFKKNSKDHAVDTLEVMVFDDTREVIMSLWEDLINSAFLWTPSRTILLLTNPGWKEGKLGKVLVNSNTFIDIDPDLYEAEWLRNRAQGMAKRAHVNPPYPDQGTQ